MTEIIYLPGFMGNELHNTGGKMPAWTLEQAILGRMEMLNLESFPADSVYPGKPLQFVYTSHLSQLKHAGFSVHFFAYNWRLPLESHLSRLHRFVNSVAGQNPFKLLGHSNGGLLAALYLHAHQNANCSGFTGIGVPVMGTDYAAVVIGDGDATLKRLMPFTNHQALRDLLRQLPSIYELLPAELLTRQALPVIARLGLDEKLANAACETRKLLDSAFAYLEKANFPLRFICDLETSMDVISFNPEKGISKEKGKGDGWIAAHRSHPQWAEPISVPVCMTDLAAAGPFGLLASWLAPHPVQPLFKTVQQAVRESLQA